MFMRTKKISWGIIGCGNVTEQKSGPAFQKVRGSELVAVMRRDAKKAEDFARRHDVPKWYCHADDLIRDKQVNAVYVATPPDTHAEYAIKSLNAGKPVYVEKPMARSYKECKEMVHASEENGVPLFVAYYRRSLPGFRKIRELINNNEIGTPRMVSIHLYKSPAYDEFGKVLPWRVVPEISGGGHFYDLASHQLDYLDYLFGPVKEVKGIAKNLGRLYAAEDTVSASMVFENGVVGSGSWCFSGSHESNSDRIEITGDNGRISFSCFGFNPVILENSHGKQAFRFEKPEHVQYYLIEEVVNELLKKGKSPSTGKTGMRTNKVMEEITKKYYKNL
jgi:predicted dehydrogenase